MKKILILVALGIFLGSTASAFQGGGGESTKKESSKKKAVTKKKTSETKSATIKPPKPPKPPAPLARRAPAEPEPPMPASVMVNSNLPNVTVKINGEAVGTTDANGTYMSVPLTPGVYTVSVAKSGYQSPAVILELAAGQNETTKFELKSLTQSLTISTTPPESEIYIDEILRGRTDVSGNLSLTDVPVGEYRIAVRKSRYTEKVFSLSLSPEKEGQINANLELAVGFLTVTTNAPNPSVDISGLGRFNKSISKFECQPGTYFVTISSPLYVTSRKDVIVRAGQEAELLVDLVADTETRSRLASEILEAYSSQQYDQAITLAKTLLSVDPKHTQALTVLAESYFMKDDFDSFAESASQAIEAGGSLTILLKHHHSNAVMHPVRIVLTAQTVAFDPQVSQLPPGSNCPNPAVTKGLNTIGASELSGNLDNEIYLQLVFAEPRNPKKPTTLRFADRESSFVKEAKSSSTRGIRYNGKTMESRKQAYGAMTAIAALLNRTTAKMKAENDSSMATNKVPELILDTGRSSPDTGTTETVTERSNKYIVPNGVIINGILENEINTKTSRDNDRFRMTVQSPDEFRGAIIDGYISGVGRSGKVSGQASVTFNFEKITLRKGQTYEFAGNLQSIKDQKGKIVTVDNEGTAKGSNRTKKAVKRGAAGAGIGAILGGILGGAAGAAAGAAIGGAAGTGSVAMEGGEDIKLKKGSTITLQSSSPIRQ